MSSTTESVDSSICEDTVRSPLWMSLYVLSTASGAVNENTVSSVPAANNPCPLRNMGDNAEYWVNDNRKAFTFKFPATIDLNGQYNRTGPYFNLPRTGLDLRALKKMQAQFEIRPLNIDAKDAFPEEVITCSSSVLDMLNVLHGEAEDARNAHEFCASKSERCSP
ncbi:hypothetical protein EV424DRAFT_1549463 [Suillus variegatus]|nr:hypothetical protein EV424DRAFT_1549463 [Suillus variegatus]